MEFRVLGKLEVLRDGHPVDLGAFRQRALLALLLTAPNSVFSTDQILDELWGVSRCRRQAERAVGLRFGTAQGPRARSREAHGRARSCSPEPPATSSQAAAEQIDSLRFERLVTEGRALVDVDPAAASLVLGESLALWRGRAFEEFTYESFAQAEIARLEELRLEAVELRVEADLRQGPVSRADLGIGVARSSASLEGTPDRPADARAVSIVAAGRGTAGLPGPQVTAR